MLYYADNLGGSGQQHQLAFSAAPSASAGQYLDIDAVTVYTSSGGSSSDHSVSHSSKPNLAVILGAALGGAVALILFGILAFFLLRWRRKTNRKFSVPPPLTPSLPIQEADVEAGFSRPSSSYFREIKLSPGGPKYPSGPSQIIGTTLNSNDSRRHSGQSYQSFKSTEAMLWPIPPDNKNMVQVPKSILSRPTPSAYPDIPEGRMVRDQVP